MYTYPPDYSCNGLAASTLDEQFYINFTILCVFTILFIVPIFIKFQHAILDKISETFQYLQYIQNVFKGYYHIYKQLQHLCQETLSKDFHGEPGKFLQVRPPLQEQISVTHHQIQQPTSTPPPLEEFLIQVRPQLYLSTQVLHPSSPLVLCSDHATSQTRVRDDRYQKFIS